MREKVGLLTSMVGVGKTKAVVLIVKLPELGKVRGKKIASLVGVTPMSDESGKRMSDEGGKRKGKRVIRGGGERLGQPCIWQLWWR